MPAKITALVMNGKNISKNILEPMNLIQSVLYTCSGREFYKKRLYISARSINKTEKKKNNNKKSEKYTLIILSIVRLFVIYFNHATLHNILLQSGRRRNFYK